MQNILLKTETQLESWHDFKEPIVTPEGNVFSGKVCHTNNQWYGSLAVLEYNGVPEETLICGMPKLRYPYIGDNKDNPEIYFDPNRKYIINLKLDGTNICFYELHGEVLPKTRLNPTVGDSKFGNFKYILEKQIDKDLINAIRQAVRETGLSLCFELWGQGNLHTVHYETPMTLTFILAVKQNGNLLRHRDCEELARKWGFQMPSVIWAGGGKDIVDAYIDIRKQFQLQNEQAREFIVEGGVVHGCNTLYKLKPQAIEELHRLAMTKIGDIFIDQAIYKVLENYGEALLYQKGTELVIDTLSEDFPEDRVLKSIKAIDHRITNFRYYQDLRNRVKENLGDREFQDIPSTLKYLSNFFEKSQMRHVYQIVKEEGGINC